MKKTILGCAIGLVALLIISSYANAQNSANALVAKKANAVKTPLLPGDGTNSAENSPAELSTINTRAVKIFNKEYRKAESVKWYSLPDGFLANCTIDGFKTKVYFDSKGKWHGQITYFNDKTMPRDIRDIVKRTYYDCAITLVEKIEVDNKIIYWVHLEDDKSIKILSLIEGEMEVVHDFQKH